MDTDFTKEGYRARFLRPACANCSGANHSRPSSWHYLRTFLYWLGPKFQSTGRIQKNKLTLDRVFRLGMMRNVGAWLFASRSLNSWA